MPASILQNTHNLTIQQDCASFESFRAVVVAIAAFFNAVVREGKLRHVKPAQQQVRPSACIGDLLHPYDPFDRCGFVMALLEQASHSAALQVVKPHFS